MQKAKGKNIKNDLSERLLEFAVNVIRLVVRLQKTRVGRHVGGQLMRSGTSPGANYEEASGAESRADFVHKLQIVLKELKESVFWLRLIKRASLLPPNDSEVLDLLQEGRELTKIIGKSVVTAKGL